MNSPFYSRELYARAMEARVLRRVVSELCEQERWGTDRLTHTPIEERIETGLSDDEYLIALAIDRSPTEFVINFEHEYLARDKVPDLSDVPEECVAPVVPFHFKYPDEVIREKAEFKRLESDFKELREKLIAEHLEKHPNEDRVQAELQTRRDYYQTEREKTQAFLDTEQLPPISKEAMFIWMDWVYAFENKITPWTLKRARHRLSELVEQEVSRIEAAIKDNSSTRRFADISSMPSVDPTKFPEQENTSQRRPEQHASLDPSAVQSDDTAIANNANRPLNGTTKTPPSIVEPFASNLAEAKRTMKDRQTPVAIRLRGRQRRLLEELLESDDYRLTHEELAREVFRKAEDKIPVKAVRNLATNINVKFEKNFIPLHISVEQAELGNLCIAELQISGKSDWISAMKRIEAKRSAES
ncbi:hypothetical protein [Rhodopirellula baltica]|uniref:Uncharacterized protein n=1 Tax=Rhodopirellula baltica WH47 TaxID=991778 RepID=F2AU27_RHOBT|nr:hypothetical protein [Rhodopirellula baltica]EGF26818.1 hypothetical protein RBWH47_04991 [Rhodopirellula baltica WH47]